MERDSSTMQSWVRFPKNIYNIQFANWKDYFTNVVLPKSFLRLACDMVVLARKIQPLGIFFLFTDRGFINVIDVLQETALGQKFELMPQTNWQNFSKTLSQMYHSTESAIYNPDQRQINNPGIFFFFFFSFFFRLVVQHAPFNVTNRSLRRNTKKHMQYTKLCLFAAIAECMIKAPSTLRQPIKEAK